MVSANFYYVSWALLIILIAWFYFSYKKHKYNSRDIAAQMVRAETMSYDSSDPAFKSVSHRKAIFGIVLGPLLFFIDWIAGFPITGTNNYVLGRGFYILITVLSGYVLISDYREKKKSIKVSKQENIS